MFPPDLIVEARVRSQWDVSSKKRLLQSVATLLTDPPSGLKADPVFDCLLERERLGSTGLGHGVALPHARVKEVDEPLAAFVQLRESVDFSAPDDQPVDLVFALLVPDEATEQHLQLLAALAQMFGDAQLREQLRRCDSARASLRVLTEWDERHADGPCDR